MSKYTTEVRYICEKAAGLDESGDYDDISTILHACHSSVIGTYPIFDESYRETLNTKILKHYYTREICEETVGLWKLRLNARMNEIMPYYNKLYQSELLSFNPLYDVDLNTTHVKNESGNENLSGTDNERKSENKAISNSSERNLEENTTSTSASTSTTNTETDAQNSTAGNSSNEANTSASSTGSSVDARASVDKYSDTPQGGITGLETGTYLTNARIVDNQDTNSQQSAQKGESSGSSAFSEQENNKTISNVSDAEQNDTSGNLSSKDTAAATTTENNTVATDRDRSENKDISSTEDYLEHVQGKRSGTSYAKLLQEYRDTFLNIDMMIITNLSDLFFGLWE